ncbi:MAG TPA: hypothetical protein QGF58_15015 [Myxococcota bacterium]|nr:hypothetical protein [Myxococcota bacterium]
MLTTLLALTGCIVDAPPPWVGECAEHPEGIYDYGEIGIGSCLAGPVSLSWTSDGSHLLVTNANPFLDFTGGSVSAIDVEAALAGAADQDDARVLVSDVSPSALDMPSFPSYGELVAVRDLLLVPNRLTESARTRVGYDDLYFVDVSDPAELAFAEVVEGGAHHLELKDDPALVAYDTTSGYAFVANLTTHSLSVVDVLADPVEIIDAVDTARVSRPRFFDSDGSGSHVEAAQPEVLIAEAVFDQEWTLSYAEGSYRVWSPRAEGAVRLTSIGDEDWSESARGAEIDVDELGLVEVSDPQPYESDADAGMLTMTFVDDGRILAADAAIISGEWDLRSSALLSEREGDWDEILGGPMALVEDERHYLFYDGTSAEGVQSIGLASGTDGTVFRRDNSGTPVLSLDGVQLADPHVLYDRQADIYRMFFSMDDGSGWVIGHAESTDLSAWTIDEDAVFVPEAGEAAAPVVTYGNFEFRMWTSRLGDDGIWRLGAARSVDGLSWTDLGVVSELDAAEPADGTPPGVGLQSQILRSFILSGDEYGTTQLAVHGGDILNASGFGFLLQLSAGAILGTQHVAGVGDNGVTAESWLVDEGLVYLTLTDADGTTSVGVIGWDGGPVGEPSVLITPESGPFDGSVSHPVVFPSAAGYTMLFAGQIDGRTAIGSATSTDGLDFTVGDALVLDNVEDWESLLVAPGSVTVEDDGSFSLYYTGSDGSRSRIGHATSSDGQTWTRAAGPSEDWLISTGAPGSFDDSAVRHPFALEIDGVQHIWYAGFDGDFWRIGHVSREADSGDDFEPTEGLDGDARPVIDGIAGNFDAIDAYRPVVSWDGSTLEMLYTGRDGGIERVGRASGTRPDRLYRDPARPTLGDFAQFTTMAGDDQGDGDISLVREVEGQLAEGLAASFLHIDDARGFLYVASKLHNYIYIIDIRDDSTEMWVDANYLDIEALLVANTDVGARSFRGLLAPEGERWLYALNTQPESIMLFDLDEVEDDDRATLFPDAVAGYIPAPRAIERDAGLESMTALGPAQLVMLGDRMLVSNFNANSVGVYDLRLGLFGELVDEVDLLGENPHALALSPDGTMLAVGNYVGEIIDGRVSSTVVILDVDETSPTYLEVLARVANQ